MIGAFLSRHLSAFLLMLLVGAALVVLWWWLEEAPILSEWARTCGWFGISAAACEPH